jgi:hypothetical protein
LYRRLHQAGDLTAQGLDLEPHERALEAFLKDGEAII